MVDMSNEIVFQPYVHNSTGEDIGIHLITDETLDQARSISRFNFLQVGSWLFQNTEEDSPYYTHASNATHVGEHYTPKVTTAAPGAPDPAKDRYFTTIGELARGQKYWRTAGGCYRIRTKEVHPDTTVYVLAERMPKPVIEVPVEVELLTRLVLAAYLWSTRGGVRVGKCSQTTVPERDILLKAISTARRNANQKANA